jgi:hypothetical protein
MAHRQYSVCQVNITNLIGLNFNISQSTVPVKFLISWKVVMACGEFSVQKRKDIAGRCFYGWIIPSRIAYLVRSATVYLQKGVNQCEITTYTK